MNLKTAIILVKRDLKYQGPKSTTMPIGKHRLKEATEIVLEAAKRELKRYDNKTM